MIYRISSCGGDNDGKNSLHEEHLTMPLRKSFAGFMSMRWAEDNKFGRLWPFLINVTKQLSSFVGHYLG